MSNVLLREFNASIIGKGRITFGDVKRLQRNILPDGIMSRDEVELLVGLDRLIARSDAAWADYLAAAVTEFVVWGERPTGTVDATTGRWLKDLLFAEEPTRTALRIAREVEKEAAFAEAPVPAATPRPPLGIAASEGPQPAALA
jgi:hypothetical protein